jgi:hypothetical protein
MTACPAPSFRLWFRLLQSAPRWLGGWGSVSAHEERCLSGRREEGEHYGSGAGAEEFSSQPLWFLASSRIAPRLSKKRSKQAKPQQFYTQARGDASLSANNSATKTRTLLIYYMHYLPLTFERYRVFLP